MYDVWCPFGYPSGGKIIHDLFTSEEKEKLTEHISKFVQSGFPFTTIEIHAQSWRDVGEGDMKIFLPNLIVMGLEWEGSMLKYWNHGEIVKTAFWNLYGT